MGRWAVDVRLKSDDADRALDLIEAVKLSKGWRVLPDTSGMLHRAFITLADPYILKSAKPVSERAFIMLIARSLCTLGIPLKNTDDPWWARDFTFARVCCDLFELDYHEFSRVHRTRLRLIGASSGRTVGTRMETTFRIILDARDAGQEREQCQASA